MTAEKKGVLMQVANVGGKRLTSLLMFLLFMLSLAGLIHYAICKIPFKVNLIQPILLGDFSLNLIGPLLALKDLFIFAIFLLASYLIGRRFLLLLRLDINATGYTTILSWALGFTFYYLVAILMALLKLVTVALLGITLAIPIILYAKEIPPLIRYLHNKMRPGYKIIAFFVIGYALYYLLTLFSSRLHWFSNVFLWGILALLLLLFAKRVPKLVRYCREKLNAPMQINAMHGFLLLLSLFYLVMAMSPPCWNDSLSYQLVIPKEYLQHRGVPEVSNILFAYYPPAMNMLYLYLMALGSDFLPKVLHYFFFLLIIATFYFHVRSLISTNIARWATLFFASQWLVHHGVQRANVDFHISFYALLSLLIVIDLVYRKKCRGTLLHYKWMILSGIFLGTAISSKYSAIFPIWGMEILLLFLLFSRNTCLKALFLLNLFAIAVCLPWLARNYLHTGSPIYHAYCSQKIIFQVRTQEKITRIANIPIAQLMNAPSTTHNVFALPFYAYFDGKFPSTNFDAFIDPLILIFFIPGLIFMRKYPFLQAVYLYLLAYYYRWLPMPMLRYAMPVLPLICLISTLCLIEFANFAIDKVRPLFQKIGESVIIGFCLVSLCNFLVNNSFFLDINPPTFLRLIDREQMLAKTNGADILELSKYMEQQGEAKIFMVLMAKVYYLKNEAFAGTYTGFNLILLQSLHASGKNPIKWLQKRGYRYLIVDKGRYRWLLNSGNKNIHLNPSPRAVNVLQKRWLFFEKQILSKLILRDKVRGISIYEIPCKRIGN